MRNDPEQAEKILSANPNSVVAKEDVNGVSIALYVDSRVYNSTGWHLWYKITIFSPGVGMWQSKAYPDDIDWAMQEYHALVALAKKIKKMSSRISATMNKKI